MNIRTLSIRFLISILLIGLVSCKKSVIPEFPKAEPDLLFTVEIISEKCFARCFSVQKAATVDPVACGLPEDNEWSWEVNYLSCDGISGFKNKTWAEELMPYFKEVSDWVYDNLGLIQSKINKLMEE